MKQMSFADAEYAGKRKQTRRERFLIEMDQVVPWKPLLALIEPHYPKGEGGRPAYPLEAMLRVHLMQNWFGYSDPAMDEALYETDTGSQGFARLSQGEFTPLFLKDETVNSEAFFWQIQAGTLPEPPAAKTLGMIIVRVDSETGELEAEFDGKREFTNPAGNIQGGFLSAMLDDTMGPALASQLAAGEFAPTLHLNVQFLSAAKVGKLCGIGRIVKRGKDICFLSGELSQEGRIVATATATATIRKL
jgi:uncharacterized protein (TIGR00369 family)